MCEAFKENFEVITRYCYNHSYFIDSSELEETLHKPKDKYIWIKFPEGMQLQSRDIFRLFPKEYITFPSRDYIYDGN